MKNETKAEKIIRTEIGKWSILKPTTMANDIIKALMKANLISSNTVLAVSLPSDVEFEKNLLEYSPYERIIIRRFYEWIKRGNDR